MTMNLFAHCFSRKSKENRKAKEKRHFLFLTNLCTPYRIPFFEGLAKIYNVEYVFWLDGRKEGLDKFGKFRYIETHNSKLSLARRLFQRDYDLVICSFEGPNYLLVFGLCKLLRKPFILWVEQWFEYETLRGKVSLPLLKFVVKNSDAFVVPGTLAKQFLLSLGGSQQKVFVGPNAIWIDPAPESDVKKIKKEIGIGNSKVVLFLGRLVKEKGVEYLIKAFSKLEKEYDVVLLIAFSCGNYYLKELQNLSKKTMTKNVIFLKISDEKQKASIFSLSDCFVLPSVALTSSSPREAWGLVLNEAMVCRKPVITTDAVGAAPDMVFNCINGFVVRNADVSSLYAAIKKVISDPETMQRMGLESRRIIENGFTNEHMVKGFAQAVEYTLANCEQT